VTIEIFKCGFVSEPLHLLSGTPPGLYCNITFSLSLPSPLV
jgi:hypothetical protein